MRKRNKAARIVGYTIIGEMVAMPLWFLVHPTPKPEIVPAARATFVQPTSVDIIPVTIYDGPLPLKESQTLDTTRCATDLPIANQQQMNRIER